MITSIADLKNRTIAESNILKSFILTSHDVNTKTPSIDDIIIHDYQIANSVTINSILSNFIVDINHAIDIINNPATGVIDSYFQIMSYQDEIEYINDDTRMFLAVDNGKGTFLSRGIQFVCDDIEYTDGTYKFVNLNTIWYGIVDKGGYDELIVVKEMNSDEIDPNSNQFSGFNDWISNQKESIRINCIIENQFANNNFGDLLNDDDNDDLSDRNKHILTELSKCKYIVCLSTGLYGLIWDNDNDKFKDPIDIQAMNVAIPTDSSYEYIYCGFKSIDEENVLFIVFKDSEDNYFFNYISEESYDMSYGMSKINLLVSEGLLTTPNEVFSKVSSFQEIGNNNIILTDYGFWDIETNQTEDKVYSYVTVCNTLTNRTKTISENININEYNGYKSKMVTPNQNMDNGDVVCEYDRLWRKSNNKWELYQLDSSLTWSKPEDGISYPDTITNKENKFIGATSIFGLYNSIYDSGCKMLIRINQNEFNKILFSMSDATNKFVNYLYNQVVDPDKGKYYLAQKNSSYANKLNICIGKPEYTNHKDLKYQVPTDDYGEYILSKLKSTILNLASNSTSDITSPELQKYCDSLQEFVTETSQLNTVLDTSTLTNKIKVYFKQVEWETNGTKMSVVNSIVDEMVSAYPALAYFKSHLTELLSTDLSSFNSDLSRDRDTDNQIASGIVSYIKSLIPTALVIGGYDSSKTGNDKYPGLDSYLYKNQVMLPRYEVENILSVANTKTETIAAVQSTKFFGQLTGYEQLQDSVVDSDLFNVSTNSNFIAKSNMMVGDQIYVDWTSVRNFLFPSSGKISEPTLLKKFIKQQIYRPLFFNPQKHLQQFTNDSTKYRCTTSTWYTNEDFNVVQLSMDGKLNVNRAESGLSDTKYTDIEYLSSTNQLKYCIHSEPIQVVDNKFVYQDVQYYTIMTTDSSVIQLLYFNEVNNTRESEMVSVPIYDSIFTLDGVEYIIQGGAIFKNQFTTENAENGTAAGTSPVSGHEYRQQIVDDSFTIDGVNYVLVKSGSVYTSVNYFLGEESKLKSLSVSWTLSEGGIAFYDMDGDGEPDVEFHFTKNDFGVFHVVVVKHHSCDVINRLSNEWCEFDDIPVTITSSHTYEWYLVNRILMLFNEKAEYMSKLYNLGNGIVYSGGLQLNPPNCVFNIENQIQSGHVVTVGYITKTIGGQEYKEYVGLLIDENNSMNIYSGKTMVGSLSNGDINTSSGTDVFILKQISKGGTNLNSVKIESSEWTSKFGGMVEIGNCNIQYDESITLTYSDPPEPGGEPIATETIEYVLSSISVPLDTGIATLYPLSNNRGYSVEVSGQSGITTVLGDSAANIVQFIANGVRYLVNLRTEKVYKLSFRPMNASTVDFTTNYGYTNTLDSLTNNLKQFMMNQILQAILTSTQDDTTQIIITPSRQLELYLDIVSDDQSLNNYCIASSVNRGTQLAEKFSQVFKNNLEELDDDEIYSGNIYKFLEGQMDQLFGGDSSIWLVNKPSITAIRDESNTDIFKYELYFDLYLRVKRDLVADDKFTYNEKYIIGDAVVRDMKCQVEFKPKITGENNVVCDVKYTVPSGDYTCECSSVLYVHDGKVRTKTENQEIIVSLGEVNKTYGNQELTNTGVLSQIFHDKITELFTESNILSIYKSINNAANDQVVIQSNSVKNMGSSGNIWELGEDIPSDADSKLTSRGNIKISGQQYVVSDDDTQLIPTGDGSRYDIVNVSNKDGVSKSNLAVGETIVNNSYLTSNFSIEIFNYKTKGKVNPDDDKYTVMVEKYPMIKYKDNKSPYNRSDTKPQTSEATGLTIPESWGERTLNNMQFITFNGGDPTTVSVSNNFTPGEYQTTIYTLTHTPPEAPEGEEPIEEDSTVREQSILKDIYDHFNSSGLSLNNLGFSQINATFTDIIPDEYIEQAIIKGGKFSLKLTENPVELIGEIYSLRSNVNLEVVGTNDIIVAQGKLGYQGVVGQQYSEEEARTVIINQCVQTYKYRIAEEDAIGGSPEITLQNTTNNEGEDIVNVVLTFELNAQRTTSYLYIKPSVAEPFYKNQYVLLKDGSIQQATILRDYKGESISMESDSPWLGLYITKSTLLKYYGFADIIVNLSSGMTGEQIEMENVYITYDGSKAIVGDGRKCPCSLEVIHPDETPTSNYQIYNRYYVVGNPITVDKYQLVSPEAAKFYLELINTKKSIRSNTTVTRGSLDDEDEAYWTMNNNAIPSVLWDKIQQLADKKLRLTSDYLLLTLTQLNSFFGLIKSELNTSISSDVIGKLLGFKYDTTLIFNQYSTINKESMDEPKGIFRTTSSFDKCLNEFNSHLQDEFSADHSYLDFNTEISDKTRDYFTILKNGYNSTSEINGEKNDILQSLFGTYNYFTKNDIIQQVFGSIQGGEDTELSDKVRYINAIGVDVSGRIVDMRVLDGVCHIFTSENGVVSWYQFPSWYDNIKNYITSKQLEGGDFSMTPTYTDLQEFGIYIDDNKIDFRCLNRDLTSKIDTSGQISESTITDAYAIQFTNGETGDSEKRLWFVSSLGGYVYAPYDIVDMAYEQYGDRLYIVFESDPHIYAFDSLASRKDSHDRILVTKETTTMKIATFNSIRITNNSPAIDWLMLDYQAKNDSDNQSIAWEFRAYGNGGEDETVYNLETWKDSPGSKSNHFKQFNTIVIGDSLFTEDEIKFQNIAKNKVMYDIVDINEVDGSYYGLFKDLNNTDDDVYIIFKTVAAQEDQNGDMVYSGVIQKLPYEVVVPKMFISKDNLYSLFVVARFKDGLDESGNQKYSIRLHEISVPNSEPYFDREIPIQDKILASRNSDIELKIYDVIMNKFVMNDRNSNFFVLSNIGFHKIGYRDDIKQLSIDTMSQFTDEMKKALRNTVIEGHIKKMHTGDAADYFTTIDSKVNQYANGFNVFDLIPTEFGDTQDVGVIPSGKIDDDDDSTDHRPDSVLVSTDILWTDGLLLDSQSNPGFVTAAISSPATMYEDDNIYTKVQRNPLIESSEYYDYIYDQKGNTLLDLYAVPFVYRVNSNNTYDIYINIPTTRTKYINRLSGVLDSDLTTQVLSDDTRTRINMLDEVLPNNLDESTTKLRVYIDRKYISIGNVELVEISGNSIPLEIYRDTPNDGLYDSIALESRWNGVVEEINNSDRDINKVMLEFECYGTDSQSIHISGKTLVNRYLDDATYSFGEK